MATFYDVLAREVAKQAADRYEGCREDARILEDTPYVHPPVVHFAKAFSILPGAVQSLTVDCLKSPERRFSAIDPEARDLLERCFGLKKLALLYVQLRSFNGLPRFPLLRSLQMQGNQIESFKGLLHQPSLSELNIWGNLLKGFKYFPCLPQLRELNASCNRIKGQLSRLVARAPKLQVLKLALNPIESLEELLPLEELKELKHLELYGCPVAQRLQEGESTWVQRLRSRGVLVVLKQHHMPPEMLHQLEQIQQEYKEREQLYRNARLPSIVLTTATD